MFSTLSSGRIQEISIIGKMTFSFSRPTMQPTLWSPWMLPPTVSCLIMKSDLSAIYHFALLNLECFIKMRVNNSPGSIKSDVARKMTRLSSAKEGTKRFYKKKLPVVYSSQNISTVSLVSRWPSNLWWDLKMLNYDVLAPTSSGTLLKKHLAVHLTNLDKNMSIMHLELHQSDQG